MIVILGLILVAAATAVGLAGVLGNDGSTHGLTGGFSVFGYDVTGSTGTLFLCGIVVGAIAMLGLSMVLASAVGAARRGRAARAELKESRRETALVSRDRDDLLRERDSDRADHAADGRTAAPDDDGRPGPDSGSPR